MIISGVQWVAATLIGQMDNREYASIILIGLLAIYLLAKGKLLSVIKSLTVVIKLALNPKILIPALILMTYSAFLIYIAFECGFWNTGILLDTILEVVFVGFPSIYIASKATSVTSIKNELIVPEVSFGALMSFYINLVFSRFYLKLLFKQSFCFLVLAMPCFHPDVMYPIYAYLKT